MTDLPETAEPSGRSASASRYRQAGIIYFLFGLVILGLTVLTPELASPERRTDIIHLLVGLPFFALFAWLIASGERFFAFLFRWAAGREKAESWGLWWREKLTMLLTISALGRTFVFAANGVGRKPGLSFNPFALTFEQVDPTPRMLVNALLMAVICIFLARASWIPFFSRFGSSSG